MELVLLFPGQGSQTPGMARDLVEAFPEARRVFEEADDTLGVPLGALAFEGPEDALTSTENAQPALLAHGAAVWAIVRQEMAGHVRGAAGHSLGEFTAHHAAGTFSLGDALRVVRRRGELMRRSGDERPGTMAAILGLEDAAVESACARAAAEGGIVVPANYNAPAQVVVSGEIAAVERAMALAKEAGAKRALRLNVSGAFHSPLMAVAADGLRAALDAARVDASAFPVWSNVTAEPVLSPDEARALLLRQLTSPVRWTDQVRAMAAAHPDALWVEMGPGTVLGGLVKRIAPAVRTAPCGTARDIDQLLQQVA
jgi:[acyl-carrier-protein] S-malonyltransferase